MAQQHSCVGETNCGSPCYLSSPPFGAPLVALGGWDPVQQCLLLSWASHPGRARSPKICLWSDLFCETINCLEEQILTTIDFDQFWLKTIMIVALVFTKFLATAGLLYRRSTYSAQSSFGLDD